MFKKIENVILEVGEFRADLRNPITNDYKSMEEVLKDIVGEKYKGLVTLQINIVEVACTLNEEEENNG